MTRAVNRFSSSFVCLTLAAGCGSGPDPVPCTNMTPGALASGATLFELDDYGAAVACDGDHAPDGAVPLDRRTFHTGESVSLQLAPGHHTVVVLAFDDAMDLLGSGCASQDLPAGGQICINVELSPAPDLAMPPGPDMTTPMPDLAGCPPGLGDCDGDPTNGCETNLVLPNACGTTCGNRVDCSSTVKNASGADCVAGLCSYSSCKGGFGDCDGDKANGCETTLTTVGSCGTSCATKVDCNTTVEHATVNGCTSGACSFTCTGGFTDCDGVASNGCETDLTALVSCGTTCGNKVDCTTAVKNANGITCSSGACGYTTCFAGWCNCSGTQATGCETMQHIDGLGDYFTDCAVANGAWSLPLGQEAANAWDSTGAINNGSTSFTGGALQYWVCNNSTKKNHTACWTYDATGAQAVNKGQVFLSTGFWLSGSGASHGTQYAWY
jgi:hypothetical protein